MVRQRSMSLGRRRSFAIVVGFGLIAAACSGGGNDHSSASTIVESSTGQSDVAATAEKAPSLVTLAGDPFEDATLAEIAASEMELLPSGFTPAGAGVDVTVEDGSVGEPLRLTVPGTSPPADAVAVLLHRNDAGMWEANPAEYRDGMYVADVSSFSPFLPGFLNPVEWFDSGSDWLTGRTDLPADCETDPYGWVAHQASGPADGSFHACVRANPDPDTGVERVEVKIKSNRSMGMWISIPDHERDYLWVEGAPDWDRYGVAITELDGGSPNRVLLGPGRTMTVGYTRPIGAGPELVFSSFQNNTTQIASLAQQYLGDLGSLGLLAAMVVCVEGANTGEGFGALALDAAVECLPKTAEMLIASGITDGAKAFGSILDTRYASIVSQGRMQLSAGASDGIEQLVNNASATGRAATAFKAAGNALLAANLLADATSMLSDTVLAFTPGLNTYTVFLVGAADGDTTTPQPPAIAPTPDVPSLDSCEGLDTSPVMFTAVSIVGSVCSWPWALVAFTEPQPRLSVATIYQEGFPAESTGYFTDVEDGVELSGYTPQGISELSGMPLNTAQLLYDALGGSDPGNPSEPNGSTTAPPPVEVASCVASNFLFIGMDGPDPEVALLQTRLRELGYDPGIVDGYFGEKTWIAVFESQSQYADGSSGGNGIFTDEQAVMNPAFERLGISC